MKILFLLSALCSCFFAGCQSPANTGNINKTDTIAHTKDKPTSAPTQTADANLLNYTKQKDLLEILAALPDSAFTSWEWKKEERGALVAKMRTYNDIAGEILPFSKVNYATKTLLKVQVVDGLWQLAIYKIAKDNYIVITDDMVSGGNDMKYFEYKNGTLATISAFDMIDHHFYELLIDKSKKYGQEYIEDNKAFFNYDFTESGITLTATLPNDDDTRKYLKANVLQLLFIPEKKMFSTQAVYWQDQH